MASKNSFPKDEIKFKQFLITEYFKYRSVEEVFRKHKYNLPISAAQYHRILQDWGVVKAAGPNNKLTEALDFFTHLADDNIPFERLYKKMPPSFQTSAVTLYRILGYIKEGVTRRIAVALIITPYDDDKKILIAHDVSTPRIELGKSYGSLSLPMGYARKRDSREINILRILQQEVFTNKVINNTFPSGLVSDYPEPFMYLDIADVRVSVYHFQLTKELSNKSSFSSFKLKDFRFIGIEEILKSTSQDLNLRSGVKDAVIGYKKHLQFLHRNLAVNPLQTKALINKNLATVKLEVEY